MRRIEGGSIAVLRHRGWQPAKVVEVDKKPGDRVIYRGRCYRIGDDGGWRDTEQSDPQPITPNAPAPTPWTVLHGRGWEALGGVALGAVFVVVAVLLLAVSK